MTGTQKLMIRKFFFSYIGKSNKSIIAVWRDLVGPHLVTTFLIPNLVEVGRRPSFVDGMIAYYPESWHFQKRACKEIYKNTGMVPTCH